MSIHETPTGVKSPQGAEMVVAMCSLFCFLAAVFLAASLKYSTGLWQWGAALTSVYSVVVGGLLLLH